MAKEVNNNTFSYLLHTVIYYIAWFAGIILAARGHVWISSLIVVICILLQLYWEYSTGKDLQGLGMFLAIVVSISIVFDSILVYTGIIIYSANPISPYLTPPWMIMIWISFAVTLYATLSRLFNHLFLLGFLSCLGFALAFRFGGNLGAAFFPYGNNRTCIFIGIIWGFTLPICVYLYQKIEGDN